MSNIIEEYKNKRFLIGIADRKEALKKEIDNVNEAMERKLSKGDMIKVIIELCKNDGLSVSFSIMITSFYWKNCRECKKLLKKIDKNLIDVDYTDILKADILIIKYMIDGIYKETLNEENV